MTQVKLEDIMFIIEYLMGDKRGKLGVDECLDVIGLRYQAGSTR